MLDTEFVDLFDTFYIDVEDNTSYSFSVNLIQVSKINLFDIFSESYLKI